MISDHFDGQRFFNPSRANGQPVSAVPRLLAAERRRWPSNVAVQPQRPRPLAGDAAVVTFVGHSTFLIQTPLGNLITDPVYSDRASPVSFAGPLRARRPAVAFDDLPRIDVVLLSHNHYDHCDRRTLRAIQRRWQPVVVTPLGNGRLVASAGVDKIAELDWWTAAARTPVPITLAPAQHFSARTPFDRNRALWGGFMIQAGGRRIFFAGDSGYSPHFAEVRERLGEPDLALLPIGAYEPRWFMKDIHMNPDEAVRAHLDLRATRSLGMHFGTFQLTPEGIDDPVIALDAAKQVHALAADAFIAPEFGASYSVA